jgi:hypothetical protein
MLVSAANSLTRRTGRLHASSYCIGPIAFTCRQGLVDHCAAIAVRCTCAKTFGIRPAGLVVRKQKLRCNRKNPGFSSSRRSVLFPCGQPTNQVYGMTFVNGRSTTIRTTPGLASHLIEPLCAATTSLARKSPKPPPSTPLAHRTPRSKHRCGSIE